MMRYYVGSHDVVSTNKAQYNIKWFARLVIVLYGFVCADKRSKQITSVCIFVKGWTVVSCTETQLAVKLWHVALVSSAATSQMALVFAAFWRTWCIRRRWTMFRFGGILNICSL